MSEQQQQAGTPSATTQNPLDLGITLALHGWSALTMAVQSNWGGPTSSDKRDWLCGAISDMIAERPETDAEDLEDVLIQVMNDEFDVVVDDETAADTADEIMRIREAVANGDTGVVDELLEKWQRTKGKKVVFKGGEQQSTENEIDGDDGDDDDEDERTGDVAMGEAPQLVSRREKVEAEVDEDGFTKVVGKKKR